MEFEYKATHKNFREGKVLEAIDPAPPEGKGWELVSVAVVGYVVIFWWKRPV